MTEPRSLPDPQAEPTISVPRAASILGISRAHAYGIAKAGEIPTIRVGSRYVVPTARFLAHYGFTQTPTAA
ncbi:helix-turn-helix domain-containing protein [Micromonospora chalcea]|uniref:helix-turn-helix domain-containing protein n=1 Tax=Micromonospora chalcea TaxID=1874 RepID=UPI0038169B41